MRIVSIRVQNFRSIRDLSLDDLGTFNIFYGPNGAGKSAILSSLDASVRLATRLSRSTAHGFEPVDDVVLDEDFHYDAAQLRLSLTIELQASDLPADLRHVERSRLSLAIQVERPEEKAAIARFTNLTFEPIHPDEPIIDLRPYTGSREVKAVPPDWSDRGPALRRWLAVDVFGRLFRRIDALRSVRPSGSHKVSDPARTSARGHVQELLAAGAFAQALHTARSSPDVDVREAFGVLRRLLTEDAKRPWFDPVHDTVADRYDIQEVVNDAGGRRRGVSLSFQSLGAEQIYTILGAIVLGGAAAAALEEPEAHLHAPTSGKLLRDLLECVVDRRDVQQLFIATHSNLFDLDPEGWFDVALHDGATVVKRRKNWSALHSQHLYEPGPARAALLDQLRMIGEDATVFRRDDGSPVTALQMIEMLETDDALAIAFVRDVHQAAVNAVRLNASHKKGASA